LILPQFKIRNRLTRLRQHWLLAGNRREIPLNIYDLVLIGFSIDPGVQADLCNLRNLVLIFVASALHELGKNMLGVDSF
jgi:hypothetical protein